MQKKFINLSVIVFIVGGFILLLGKQDWFPEFYNPDFMGIMSFISALLIFLPRIFFKKNNESIINFQFAISLGLALNGFGAIGLFKLYEYGIPYDKIVHFFVSFVLIIGLSNFLMNDGKSYFKKPLLVSFLAIIFLGFSWEIMEILFDAIFKTQTFGVYGQDVIRDTFFDIVNNFLGAISGMLILNFKRKFNK
ncbi:hypothetical protein KKD04_00095 [Patescibacteria group bacterium]|nr:hypothetical protein [Patescibacteria group bacterium]